MRIDEFTNDKQKLELLKLIIDNVWASFEQETKTTPVNAKKTKPLKPLDSKVRLPTKAARKRKITMGNFVRSPSFKSKWPNQPKKPASSSTPIEPTTHVSSDSNKLNFKSLANQPKSPYKPYPNPYKNRIPYTA